MEPITPSDDDRLMFGFAHDLRAGLRTVITRVQMAQAGAKTQLPEREGKFLADAVGAAQEMNALISAVTSYWEASTVSEECTSLALLLRGALLEMKSVLTEAGAEVSIANEADASVPSALGSVIRELLTNSCRFRRREVKAEIRISAQRPNPETVEIAVQDNGTGVDPALLEKMFTPFRRMHARADYPGFGLGLARCRRVVEACGGNIAAAVPAGGGFSVAMKIPLTQQ